MTDNERKEIYKAIDRTIGGGYDRITDVVVEIENILLPAPTQDGTAEEVYIRMTNEMPWIISDNVRPYVIEAIETYAAPLRAEIERLKKDLDAQIYAKEHFRIQSVDMQLEMYNTFVSLKHKEDELTASNQRVKELEADVEEYRQLGMERSLRD